MSEWMDERKMRDGGDRKERKDVGAVREERNEIEERGNNEDQRKKKGRGRGKRKDV